MRRHRWARCRGTAAGTAWQTRAASSRTWWVPCRCRWCSSCTSTAQQAPQYTWTVPTPYATSRAATAAASRIVLLFEMVLTAWIASEEMPFSWVGCFASRCWLCFWHSNKCVLIGVVIIGECGFSWVCCWATSYFATKWVHSLNSRSCRALLQKTIRYVAAKIVVFRQKGGSGRCSSISVLEFIHSLPDALWNNTDSCSWQ